MRRSKPIATLLAAALVLSAFAPLGAMAVEDGVDPSVNVEQTDEEVVVTVSDNGSTVENASVTVETIDGNESYVGEGEYATGENGTVALEPPNSTVEVNVTAIVENATASKAVTLEAYEGDEPGGSFGALVSEFVASLEESDGQIGLAVANFVVQNNPGNAPEHAGPPAHAGPGGDEEQGPPDYAGPDGDDEQGPPENAGPDGDDEAEQPDDAESDGEQGPPDDAGPDDESGSEASENGNAADEKGEANAGGEDDENQEDEAGADEEKEEKEGEDEEDGEDDEEDGEDDEEDADEVDD